jgi:hypothetical protein
VKSLEQIRQLSLVVVVLCALAAALSVLRKRGFNLKWPEMKRKPRRLEVLERLALSPQTNLVLVRLDECEILIASAGGGCTVLEQRKTANGAAA